jgi:hypothetical protein
MQEVKDEADKKEPRLHHKTKPRKRTEWSALPSTPALYSRRVAAELLGISTKTLDRRIWAKELGIVTWAGKRLKHKQWKSNRRNACGRVEAQEDSAAHSTTRMLSPDSRPQVNLASFTKPLGIADGVFTVF